MLLASLHQIKEEDGDVAGAAEVLQEVHVETYGALTKKEKADFILEQVKSACAGDPLSRLLLAGTSMSRANARFVDTAVCWLCPRKDLKSETPNCCIRTLFCASRRYDDDGCEAEHESHAHLTVHPILRCKPSG